MNLYQTGHKGSARVLNSGFVLRLSSVDQSGAKGAAFKVAPSKWEAVDEAELESQGNFFKFHSSSLGKWR